eukprot:CAMPEP_0168521442 /NCGR_PEP_ID=MMETSP0405-20121227/8670_1 /TAXON_ID=498012 /ORGANISM="Trichosphaerium sp, Strain Am-I-7 wt" /LENGTH=30 /DNA_ID= /DNA_START= /DNA_END= /DNA_ORIENTATION=
MRVSCGDIGGNFCVGWLKDVGKGIQIWVQV